jgi:hypothetical protein
MLTLTLATATPAQIEAMHQFRRQLLSYRRTASYAVPGGWRTQTRPAPPEADLPEEEFFDWMVAAGHFG